jgi:DNA-binding XRE family transcriptional regulator
MRLRNRLVLGAFVDNAGMSEREVARRAGLSHSTVNHLITGRRATCTLSTAIAIARTVHCPIGALFIAEREGEAQAVDGSGSNCRACLM